MVKLKEISYTCYSYIFCRSCGILKQLKKHEELNYPLNLISFSICSHQFVSLNLSVMFSFKIVKKP